MDKSKCDFPGDRVAFILPTSSKKPSRQAGLFAARWSSNYGVVTWTEWLPWGTMASAEGSEPVG
jgi:hypothetical protein